MNLSAAAFVTALIIVAEPTMIRAANVNGSSSLVGVQCTPYGEKRPQGPRNYSVFEIGKRGVPELTRDQRKMLASIRKFVRSRSLRFTFIESDFVVFDAVDGPCFDGGAPGYPVLNGACNEYYEPGEDPRKTAPAPGCIGPPRPWIPSDKGLPGDPRVWTRVREKCTPRCSGR